MEENKGVRRGVGGDGGRTAQGGGRCRCEQRSSSRGQWCRPSPEAVVSLQHIHDSASRRSQQLVHSEERGVTTPPIMGSYAGVLHTQVLEEEEEEGGGRTRGYDPGSRSRRRSRKRRRG